MTPPPAPPTRDPSNPNYPRATELPDGTLPPSGAEGNFIIGPTHAPAPEIVARDGVPRGTITSFTLSSKDSMIYNPGLIRDDPAGCSNGSIMVAMTAPGDKSNMVVTTNHPGTWTRTIEVYVPAQYVRGTEAPFIVIGDGGSTAYKDLATTLDNLIAQPRVPPMIAIQIGNGGQDAQGSERSRSVCLHQPPPRPKPARLAHLACHAARTTWARRALAPHFRASSNSAAAIARSRAARSSLAVFNARLNPSPRPSPRGRPRSTHASTSFLWQA